MLSFWRNGILVFHCQNLSNLAMIGFGSYLLATGTAGPQASISNLWALGGFFPFGIEGLVMAMAVIILLLAVLSFSVLLLLKRVIQTKLYLKL